MKMLVDALNWKHEAKAFAMTEKGEKVLIEFIQNGDNGEWSFWLFYDDNKQDRTLDDVHLTFIDFDHGTSADGLMQQLWEDMDWYYGLDIDAPIWQEVTE